MKKECIAMLLAGGQGSRLGVLTRNLAKPAVPFGGKYRIIDFPLSNCTNSGIDVVGVLTQYRPLELNGYIGSGQPWELDRMYGGVHILPPYQSATGAVWYKGTANAIYQNMGFVDLYDPEYVLVLSGDHIYKMDYAAMLAYHEKTGITVLLVSHSMEDIAKYANRVLVMHRAKIAMYDTVEKVFAHAQQLLELGLSVPQVTQIFLKLRQMGLDIPADVYTIPYAVKTIRRALAAKQAGEVQ